MSQLIFIGLVPLVSLSLVLAFLLFAYLRGGTDDLKAVAEAIRRVLRK